jgi:hypothetical protein
MQCHFCGHDANPGADTNPDQDNNQALAENLS